MSSTVLSQPGTLATMNAPVAIAIVADFNSGSRSHIATNDALAHSAKALGLGLEPNWVATSDLENGTTAKRLAGFAGLWIGPGSPYASMDGALSAIRLARERRIPLLGTCGGFQHIIIEYARNVLGYEDAEHQESAPDATRHVISRLACSLAGRTMTITPEPGSMLAEVYSQKTVKEEYLCNFGVNPDYVDALRRAPLRVAASDDEGAVRAAELPGHPFFIGTLFLPQHRSTVTAPHLLITRFLNACAARTLA
jgi:CTP synthase (UTP-ammonia lyase)